MSVGTVRKPKCVVESGFPCGGGVEWFARDKIGLEALWILLEPAAFRRRRPERIIVELFECSLEEDSDERYDRRVVQISKSNFDGPSLE